MKKAYRNVERTKRSIQSAFFELLEERKSLDYVTVTDLVNKAEVSKSTFYYHYSDIYDLVNEIESDAVSKLSQLLDEIEENSDRAGLEKYIEEMVRFLETRKSFYSSLMNSEAAFIYLERLKYVIRKRITSDAGKYSFSSNDQTGKVQVHMLTNAVVDTLADYYRGAFSLPLQEITNVIVETCRQFKKTK